MNPAMPDPGSAETSDTPKEPKVIKRYSNRKLYDTSESRYVTLDEIAQMIKGGVEVRIVDNRSKEDLTSVTLAQIIFEEEKKAKANHMPLSLLREIIRRPGESLSGFFQREVSPRVASIREGAESRLDKLFGREEGTGSEGMASELFKSSQRTLEDWQRRIDERVRQTAESLLGNLPALGRDLHSLINRIERLEKRLDALERPKDT